MQRCGLSGCRFTKFGRPINDSIVELAGGVCDRHFSCKHTHIFSLRHEDEMKFSTEHPQDLLSFSAIVKRGVAFTGAASERTSETFTGYQPLIKPAETQRAKLNGRKQAARILLFLDVCIGCGADAEERHHKDGNPSNNAKDNLVPLCGGCHQLAHSKYPRRNGENRTCSWAWGNPV